GIAQPGSALVWGTSGRRFESGYPDQTFEARPARASCFPMPGTIRTPGVPSTIVVMTGSGRVRTERTAMAFVVLVLALAAAPAGLVAGNPDGTRAPPAPVPEHASAASAIDPPRGPDDGIVDLDAMVVSGAQPGPGMWKVTRGDHVVHILGTV